MATTRYSRADSGMITEVLTPFTAGQTKLQRPPRVRVRRHILVVEDDLQLRLLITLLLSRAGYDVDGADDGAAGWEALQAVSYDLLITDHLMPTLTGLELLIKVHGAGMTLPVIMATGTPPEQAFQRRPWLRPTATLVKPYPADELLRTVRKVLEPTEWIADAFQVPAREVAPCTDRSPGSLARSGAPRLRPRILVADEDCDLRLMYTDLLGGTHSQVDAVADSATAWEAVQANNYQLLITEHALPRLNGVDLAMKVRAARLPLPIVMAANQLPVQDLERNRLLQLTAVLSKPFAASALLATVNDALRGTLYPPNRSLPCRHGKAGHGWTVLTRSRTAAPKGVGSTADPAAVWRARGPISLGRTQTMR